MAVRTITTKLALDGEREFKKALGNIDSALNTLKTEMSLVDAQFKGQANSVDALTAKHDILSEQVDQQEEKVRALTEALTDAEEAFAGDETKIDGYRQKLNRAKTELIRLNDELHTNRLYLDEATISSDGCAVSIDEFGRKVKDAEKGANSLSDELDDLGDQSKDTERRADGLSDAIDDLGDEVNDTGGELSGFRKKLADAFDGAKNEDGSWNVEGLIHSLGNLKSLLAGGAIVGGLTQLYGAIKDVVEETQEYRAIMGTLETSSEAAGYSAEETAEAYDYLYGVLADTQKAATTVANLQAIGLEQQDLMTIVAAATGAWSTYGDSIPIDGLSEAINETIQARKVTGVFADVLVWAGQSEDDFNERLAAATDTMGAAQIVLNQLSSQGLPDAAAAWRENNTDITAYNDAQNELNDALADLGEALTPLVTSFTQFKSSVLRELTPIITTIGDLIDKIVELGNHKFSVDPQPVDDRWEQNFGAGSTGYGTGGSHASGLDRVPYDNYLAMLHRDEMVLTAREASEYRDGSSGEPTTIIVHTHVDLDGREVGKSVTEYQDRDRRSKGR